MGAQMDNLEWAHLPGTLRYGRKGLWRWSVFLCGSSVKGTWREGSLAGNPEGYVGKALEMGISLCGGSVGQPGVGSSTGDFVIWLKGALEVECLSLWERCERKLEGGLPCRCPLRMFRKGSGDGFLFS